jgi:death-on-curing protein
MNDKLDIYADQDEKYDLVISVSKGETDFEQIKDWLEKHSS